MNLAMIRSRAGSGSHASRRLRDLRAEAGKVTARLVRMVRDVDLAEEIAQEALVSALERWPEIARAFLVPQTTVQQRIVRAKQTLAEKQIPFEVPRAEDLGPRVAAVLEVVYLVFNEGYSATAGEDWMRPALCEDALRLGRVLSELVPANPDVHALVALMEIQASRTAARAGPGGEPVLMLEQDRSLWDHDRIARGLSALVRAEKIAPEPTAYVIQAQIAACHARAKAAADTDWARIAALYEALGQVMPGPVVDLNRAVALGMAFGPAAGLELIDAIAEDPALAGYHLLPAVRGDLLAKLGCFEAARIELERAAKLTQNERERAMLRARARACTRVHAPILSGGAESHSRGTARRPAARNNEKSSART